MPVMNPPNSPNTILVQVPLPQPVQSSGQNSPPPIPQPAPEPPKRPKPVDPFKKIKGPPVMILPHINQGKVKMGRSGKSIKFSKEAAEALVPRVQADPHDYAARGALADALEESGLHHDDETLDHLRAFDRPVYGMLHPESNKYVFSPRRRWLLGEVLKHLSESTNLYENHHQLSNLLKTIKLDHHANFVDGPIKDPETGRRIGGWVDIQPINKWAKGIDRSNDPAHYGSTTTHTPHGFELVLNHYFGSYYTHADVYPHYNTDEYKNLYNDLNKHIDNIAQEHKEMQEEDRLYSDLKKKEQFKKKRKKIKFARHDIPEIMDSIASNPDDPMLHHVLSDALEEQGYTALPNLIRSHLNGNKPNQEMPLVKVGENPMNDIIDHRTGDLNWWINPYSTHGDFSIFHEYDGDQKDNKHILYFIHNDSARNGHPRVRYQFQLAPHEFYQLAEEMSDDEKHRLGVQSDGDIVTGGDAGHQIKKHLDRIIANLNRRQQETEDAEPIPFNRNKKAKFGLLESTGKKIDSALDNIAKVPGKAANAIRGEYQGFRDAITQGRFFEHTGRRAEQIGGKALGAVKGIGNRAWEWGKSLYEGLKRADRKISPMLERLFGIAGNQTAPVKKIKKPIPKQSRADQLFGNHSVRGHLEHYANNWNQHPEKRKAAISQLAKAALEGRWYSKQNANINVFHEIQRQLQNMGHKDADRIKWSDYYDELVKKIRSKKKMQRKGKSSDMARFRSPAGGMLVRGQFYPGGKLLPKEATESRPAPNKKNSGHAHAGKWGQVLESIRQLSGSKVKLSANGTKIKKKRKTMSDKPIRFSREAVESLVPRVQEDHSDFAARGALADALEESGLHHDDETLNHLRSFDRPVYGMKHPESNKYVFSPRRRWLLGELLKSQAVKQLGPDGYIKENDFDDIAKSLNSIGLPGHAGFFTGPSSISSRGTRIDRMALMAKTYPTDKDISRPDDSEFLSTITPHGITLSFAHPINIYTQLPRDVVQDDFKKLSDNIAQEHKEMQEEDRLYSESKKKEQFKRKRKMIKFSKEAAESLVPRVQSDPNDIAARGALADALEESGLHHDDETLEHLRAFDRPVYGMQHPDSGKYVFSPRRRWLLGELLSSERVRDNHFSFTMNRNLKPENRTSFSDLLNSIGLPMHSQFVSSKIAFPDESEAYHNKVVLEKDKIINDHMPYIMTTTTPQGRSLRLIHRFNYLPSFYRESIDYIAEDAKRHQDNIAQEHKEMQEEDRLYSEPKKKD